MTFKMPTYIDAIAADDLSGGFRLETRDGGSRVKFACPCCGEFVNAFQLIDFRSFPETFIESLPVEVQVFGFACDGCWTGWEREGYDCGNGETFDEAVLYEYAGMPDPYLWDVQHKVATRHNKYRDSHGAALDNALEAKGLPARDRVRNLGATTTPRKRDAVTKGFEFDGEQS